MESLTGKEIVGLRRSHMLEGRESLRGRYNQRQGRMPMLSSGQSEKEAAKSEGNLLGRSAGGFFSEEHVLLR